jgi:AhpD family alkylhydroperoxidase
VRHIPRCVRHHIRRILEEFLLSHYHDRSDLGHLRQLKKAAPREFAAWAGLDAIVGIDDGEIPRKYRELIAVAVAHATQCVYCLDVHTTAAAQAGASRAEVAEASLIAAALRAGAAAAHAALTMRLYDETGADAVEPAAAGNGARRV